VGRRDDWLTPRPIVERLGPFDLDPCAAVIPPWATATRMISLPDDGLAAEWEGRVWCNPPYSKAGLWAARMAEHGRGVALLFARTDTRWWWDNVWMRACSVFFIRGRLRFTLPDTPYRIDGAASHPSVLVVWSREDAVAVQAGLRRLRLRAQECVLRIEPPAPVPAQARLFAATGAP